MKSSSDTTETLINIIKAIAIIVIGFILIKAILQAV